MNVPTPLLIFLLAATVVLLAVGAVVVGAWLGRRRGPAPVKARMETPTPPASVPVMAPASVPALSLVPQMTIGAVITARPATNTRSLREEIEQYTRWYLLSRFERGADAYAFGDHPAYADRLGASPDTVLHEFVELCWIQKFSAQDSLEYNLKVVDLKEILQLHGLPVSGRKSDLVQRVLGLDDARVRQASQSPFFILTDAGRVAIDPFYRDEVERHRTACVQIEDALNDGDIGQALALSHAYNRLLMWGAARVQNDSFGRQVLTGILTSKLGGEGDRKTAAMMALMPAHPPGVPTRIDRQAPPVLP